MSVNAIPDKNNNLIIPPVNNTSFVYAGNGGYSINPALMASKDTFEKSNNNDEKKNNRLKWTGIIGGAVLAAGICFAIWKRRSSQVKQLAEHMTFQPAKTIEEAKSFAKSNFGIRRFDVNNLDIANYVNEGLTNASNISKGKIVLPNAVKEEVIDSLMAVRGRTLIINPNYTCSYIETSLKEFGLSGIYKNLSFREKVKTVMSQFYKGSLKESDEFSNLYHELGHLNHEHQNKRMYDIYRKAGSGHDITKGVTQESEEHVTELLTRNILDDTRNKISTYAALYPNEYVAEVYSIMMSGKTLSKEIMDLYYKYGGPIIGKI